jgi:hypothetical protein
MKELVGIANAVIGDRASSRTNLLRQIMGVAKAFSGSVGVVRRSQSESLLTLRNWSRMMGLGVRLCAEQRCEFNSALRAAFVVTSLQSLPEMTRAAVMTVVHEHTSWDSNSLTDPGVDIIAKVHRGADVRGSSAGVGKFVLDKKSMPARYQIANFVAICKSSGLPVLLEGKISKY